MFSGSFISGCLSTTSFTIGAFISSATSSSVISDIGDVVSSFVSTTSSLASTFSSLITGSSLIVTLSTGFSSSLTSFFLDKSILAVVAFLLVSFFTLGFLTLNSPCSNSPLGFYFLSSAII